MFYQKTGKACGPKEGGATSDGGVWDERAPCLQVAGTGSVDQALSKPARRTRSGVAGEDARAGGEAAAIRIPAVGGTVAAGRASEPQTHLPPVPCGWAEHQTAVASALGEDGASEVGPCDSVEPALVDRFHERRRRQWRGSSGSGAVGWRYAGRRGDGTGYM